MFRNKFFASIPLSLFLATPTVSSASVTLFADALIIDNGKTVKSIALPPQAVQHIQLNKESLSTEASEVIELNLPGLEIYMVERTRIVPHGRNGYTWIGSLVGYHRGEYRVIISYHGDSVNGRIHTPEGVFQIRQIDGQLMLIDLQKAGLKQPVVLNDGILPTNNGESIATPVVITAKRPDKGGGPGGSGDTTDSGGSKGGGKGKNKDKPTDSTTDDGSSSDGSSSDNTSGGTSGGDTPTDGSPAVVDVLVLYSDGFAAAYPDTTLQNRLNYLATLSNQAYLDSGVDLQIRFVHQQQISYNELESNTNTLQALTNGTGAFSNIASLRDQYSADLVVYIRDFQYPEQVSCGNAWLYQGASWFGNSYAYAVVSDGMDSGYYCTDYTFTHELGHNMGSQHEAANAYSTGAYSYSYGWGVNGAFGTIMSYIQPVTGLFSNPDLTCADGYLCGSTESSNNPANNSLSINNTKATISNFR